MVFSNLLLIVVIDLNRTLHEPMYLLLCSLFLNELYGSAALLPFLLVHILRDVHLVPAYFCFFQIHALHSYATVELFTLASMSYDRYVAICQPLHYKSVMSWRKTAVLVLFPWSYGLIMIGVMISLSSSLELCGNVIDKVYCDNYPLVKLACYDTSSINIYGIVGTVNVVCGPLVLILFSYVRILRVCQRGSRHTWHKAVHTCSPHLASLLNFTVAAFFEVLQGRFNLSHVPKMLRIFLSLYFLLCQPLFNPLIYGLVLTKIRLICKGLLCKHNCEVHAHDKVSSVSPFRRHNSTLVSSFVLSAYSNPGSLRWLFFCVLLLLYLLMVFSNLLLIVVIALNRTLHEPMYLLLCSLFLNELYGSAALLPFLLVHILRDMHLVPAHFCFFQIYAIHSYGTVELLTLASMSYDRYVAICQPLHYKSFMSCRKTAALVLFPWSYGLIITGVLISLSSSLELCDNVIDKVYCDNYPLVKLACYDTSSINIYGIAAMVNLVFGPLVLILFSYGSILRVCQRGSRHTWHKAVHTCSPHLASLLNFTVAGFFEVLQGRFDLSHVPKMLRVFLSLYFLLCQPLFNPLIYGLVLTKIRLICKGLFKK
ncbi:hypothetical protein WMY93_018448 [Mugilogobius chulae]|uniref:G-protein coupled receptors family 1 profile domain-containing protein n=1 Tax=Mugilogobius chulae TaxID=88201 RepID=A0AAW0NQE1_9GOBI